MFINCPYCSQLVATDPVHDLPPTHCPHCSSLLRRDQSQPDDEADDVPALDFNELMKQQAQEDTRFVTAVAVQDKADQDDAVIDASAQSVSSDTDASDRQTSASEEVVSTPIKASPPDEKPARKAAQRTPSFARGNLQKPRPSHDGRMIAVAVALVLLLLLQLLLADRARLGTDAKWRPVLSAICTAFRCELPPWREPAAFTLLQRDVRQHPTIPGALRVSATFRNDARWSQPWPHLQLTLSDANGRAAGERSFEAREYLGGTPNQSELAHGESATVAMDIMEPAAQIVAYDFKFR